MWERIFFSQCIIVINGPDFYRASFRSQFSFPCRLLRRAIECARLHDKLCRHSTNKCKINKKARPRFFDPGRQRPKPSKQRERKRRKRKLLWLQVRLKRQIRETKNNLRDQKTKLIFILSTKQLFLKAKLEKKLIFLVKANQLFWNWNKKVYKIPKNVLSGSFVTVLIKFCVASQSSWFCDFGKRGLVYGDTI